MSDCVNSSVAGLMLDHVGYPVYIKVNEETDMVVPERPRPPVLWLPIAAMLDTWSILNICGLSLAVFLLVRYSSNSRRGGPFPPGPKGLPFLGNIFDVPTEFQWETFSKWGDQWGKVYICSHIITT